MLSYANELAFGITADFDAMPDVEELSRGIERGPARLVAISDERLGSSAPPDRRVLSGRHERRATLTGIRAD